MSTTPKTLNVTECHQLLNQLLIKDGTPNQFRKGIRNHLMALLMLDAGLRVGEVVRLTVSDLYFTEEPVGSVVLGETLSEKGCQRAVPTSSRLYDAIKTMNHYWWSERPDLNGLYAFYTTHRMVGITTRQVERIIRNAALKCLGRPVHPHILRHTFGTRLMRKTNARIVQELLGHKNMSSTQIYTHPNGEDLKQAIDDIEPPPSEFDHRQSHS